MEISNEYLLREDPDVIYVLDRTVAIGGEETSQSIEDNPITQETTAYNNDSIINLSPADWYFAEGGAETFEIMMGEVSSALE